MSQDNYSNHTWLYELSHQNGLKLLVNQILQDQGIFIPIDAFSSKHYLNVEKQNPPSLPSHLSLESFLSFIMNYFSQVLNKLSPKVRPSNHITYKDQFRQRIKGLMDFFLDLIPDNQQTQGSNNQCLSIYSFIEEGLTQMMSPIIKFITEQKINNQQSENQEENKFDTAQTLQTQTVQNHIEDKSVDETQIQSNQQAHQPKLQFKQLKKSLELKQYLAQDRILNQDQLKDHLLIEDQEKVDRQNQSLKNLQQKRQQSPKSSQSLSKKSGLCSKHSLQTYYLCINQYSTNSSYLCNRCILKIKEGKHQGHEILCKRHRQQLKYLYNQGDSSSQDGYLLPQQIQAKCQIFICESCAIAYNKLGRQKPITLISQCHYTPITSLCVQQFCVKKGKSKICSDCQDQHKGHEVINFNKQSLMKYFCMKKQDNISQCQGLCIQIRQRLKLGPIKKIIDSYVQQQQELINILQAILVCNNQLVDKWIHSFLASGQKKEIHVLWEIRNLQQKGYDEKKKKGFLEMLYDNAQKELNRLYLSFKDQIDRLRDKISHLMAINSIEVQNHITQKYRTVVNIEQDNKMIQNPCRLQDIDPSYLQHIKEITISKTAEFKYLEQIQKRYKKKRQNFYNQKIKKIIQPAKISKELQKNLQEFLLNQKDLKNAKFPKAISCLIDEHHLERQLQNKIKDAYSEVKLNQRKLKQFPHFAFLQPKRLVNLRKLKLQYRLKQEANKHQTNYYYQLSFFKLFKMIIQFSHLEQFSIKGVRTADFQRFIQDWSPINCQKARLNSHLKHLKLSFRGQLQFNILQPQKTQKMLDNFRSFQSLFSQIQDMVITIHFWRIKASDLDCLISVIMMVNKLKNTYLRIKFFYISGQLLVGCFRELTHISSINAISFKEIDLSDSLQPQELQQIQSYMQSIFNNNTINYLRIQSCIDFPEISQLSTLKTVQLISSEIKFKKQSIQQSTGMRQLAIIGIIAKGQSPRQILDLHPFSKLERIQLDTEKVGDAELMTIPSWKHVKYLALRNYIRRRKITTFSLQKIFAQLTALIELTIENIDCNASAVLLIPSHDLRTISFINNTLITNQCLSQIDCKWPCLSCLKIKSCQRLNRELFESCKFRELLTLEVDNKMNEESRRLLACLKKRGIEVTVSSK